MGSRDFGWRRVERGMQGAAKVHSLQALRRTAAVNKRPGMPVLC